MPSHFSPKASGLQTVQKGFTLTGFDSAWKLLVFQFGSQRQVFPWLHSAGDELLLPLGACHTALFQRHEMMEAAEGFSNLFCLISATKVFYPH